jgi:hypothetical protein
MAYIAAANVNDWLEATKSSVADPLAAGMMQLAQDKVLGRLAATFDTTTWLDEDTTPALIVTIMSMLYAASYYRMVYSEDLEDGVGLNWAQWLEQSAEGYLTMIIDGTLELPDLGDPTLSIGYPSFYPNDLAPAAKFGMEQQF